MVNKRSLFRRRIGISPQAAVAETIAESALLSAVSGLQVGVAWLTRDGRFVASTPVYRELTGRRPDEALPPGLADVTHKEDRAALTALLERIPTLGSQSLARRMLRAHGGSRWMKEYYQFQPGVEGAESRVLALSVSDHEERVAVQTLKENGDPVTLALAFVHILQPAAILSDSLDNLAHVLRNPPESASQAEIIQDLSITAEQITKSIRETFLFARKQYLGQ